VDRATTAVLVVAAGAAVGAQAPVNATLGRSVGTVQAAAISFAVGLTILCGIVVAFGGGFGGLRAVGDVPWWGFLGGAFGAAIVSVSIIGVRTLGATGVTAAVVAGQLTASVAIDALGLFGVERHPVSVQRVCGVVLLALGVLLVVRD
jgi:transporter family-2 protein